MCQLCANHGIFNQPKKGHKQKCPHRNCICSLCALNTKRRALDQIERQLKSASNEAKNEASASKSADDFVLSSMSIKLPPTLSTPVSVPHQTASSTSSYSVALPATISRRDLRGLFRDELRPGVPLSDVVARKSLATLSSRSTTSPRTLKAAAAAVSLTNIQRNHRSIFHSAEQLAGTS